MTTPALTCATPETHSRLLIGVFCFVLFLFIILNATGAPFDFQSDHRLLPLFLFIDGHPVYNDPATGPILSTLYPPLSFLVYLPAAMFRTPGGAIIAAKLIAQVLFVGPILLLLWFRYSASSVSRATSKVTTLALMLMTLVCILSDNALNHGVLLHADAPALCLCFMACLLTGMVIQNARMLTVAMLAVSCVLAPWAKQPAGPIILVPLIVLGIERKWRTAALFLASYIGFQVFATIVFFWIFRHQEMAYWLFEVPRLQLGVSRASLFGGIRTLGREHRLLCIFTVLRILSIDSWRETLLQADVRLEIIFLLASVVCVPLALLGAAKPGGGLNSLLYFAYFSFIAFLLFAERTLLEIPPSIRQRTAVYAIGLSTVLLGGATGTLIHNSSVLWNLHGSKVNKVFAFARRHPGEVWFPRYPLTIYLAEGRVYHSDMAFFDLGLIHNQVSSEHLLELIPGRGERIACAEDCDNLIVNLSEYKAIEYRDIPSGWQVYERRDSSVAGLSTFGLR